MTTGFERKAAELAKRKYDLAVAYRIYPEVAQSAKGLPASANKLNLSEMCLRSFKESLADIRVKLWVLLDGCTKDYEDLFRRYFDPEDLVLIPLEGCGNQGTFAKQLEILLEQSDSEVVYFAEDDYFYQPGQFHCMIEFLLTNDEVHFISPYDHLDYYTMSLHQTPKRVAEYIGRQWKTVASTCMTFLTRRATLAKTKAVFGNYKRRSLDCSMWLSLTRKRVFDPFFLVSNLFREPLFCKIVVKSWLYFWSQLLFGRKWNLWVPVPAIATHLDANALSPNVDWHSLMEQQEKNSAAAVPTVKYIYTHK
jgi:hypothetical protein